MNSTRKLSLKRERLTELSADQLDGLAGGLATGGPAIAIRGGGNGPTEYYTCSCPTANPCNSVDVQPCVTFRTACPSETCGGEAILA